MKGKILFLVFWVMILSAACFAQTSTEKIQDIVVIISVSADVKYADLKLESADSKTPYVQAYNPYSNAPAKPRDSVQEQKTLETVKLKGNRQGIVKLKIKNNSGKKIDSVDYSFQIIDKKSGQNIKKYSLVNETNIKPWRTAELTNLINPDFNSTSVKYEAQVTRINFADGTFLNQ